MDARAILKHPIIYNTYQKLVGGYRARQLFVKNNVNAKTGQRILDIGCGPGYILDFLPKVEYTGIDLDKSYIEQAKKKYGSKGHFICKSVDDFILGTSQTFDIVIAAGVLHHLDDNQCINLFNITKKALKPGGKFVSFDGVYVKNQNKIAKYFLDKDRGQFIRNQKDYEQLTETSFSKTLSTIDHSYFYIPYTSIIMECYL
ncbi:class I SAM-dependent methyltransferase [Tamlana sp. I1]|uniref:class I SAM-dependent methyltransferase n=1 Tax=Tamlana sp. I1 TaxID=2762061 RepID=UPI00188E7DD1|nr:class I SAM-dependent methyltransferase [Tamlana sp. I1]